jgi:chromosome segregation ATPase
MSDPLKVEALIHIASRLISVLEREVSLLREMKSSEVASMQPEKMQLVVAYEDHVRALASTSDILDNVTPALYDEFTTVAERFDAAMTENRRALTAAREAQDRFLKAVVKAAREKKDTFNPYSQQGTVVTGGKRKGAPSPLSLSLNSHI